MDVWMAKQRHTEKKMGERKCENETMFKIINTLVFILWNSDFFIHLYFGSYITTKNQMIFSKNSYFVNGKKISLVETNAKKFRGSYECKNLILRILRAEL